MYNVEATIREFMAQGDLFTSIDIANAVKMDGSWVRNRDVADYLRTNWAIIAGDMLASGELIASYEATPTLMTIDKMATIYHPYDMSPDNYTDRDQEALPPTIKTDRLDIELAVGDKVCYPNRKGSNMWMVDAIIKDITPKGIDRKSVV